jgi:Protein of unknown function (DUF2806)
MSDNPPAQLPAQQPDKILALIQGSTAVPQAVAKLINTVGEQAGLLMEPTHIRRKAQAMADAALIQAKAEVQIAKVELQGKIALQDAARRAQERVARLEEKRQQNIETITVQATKELAPPESQETVSEQPVDEDWVAQFLNHCQDVSNEQMQTVWARILAGEVTQPGSFSLRTLNLVRNMSKEDANLFTRFCSTVWNFLTTLHSVFPDQHEQNERPVVNYSELVHLDSLGLIRLEGVGQVNARIVNPCPVFYCEQAYIFRVPARPIKQVIDFPVGNAILTEQGQQLATIAGALPNVRYRDRTIARLRRQGWAVEEVALEDLPTRLRELGVDVPDTHQE